MSGMESELSIQYTSFQQSFMERVSREYGPGSAHLLFAPAGTGKSFAIAGVISDLVGAQRARRVLVLCPAALVQQWVNTFNMRDVNVSAIDGRALRLLQVGGEGLSQEWPEGIYLMSIDLAKRENSVTSLSGISWDLVVVDEAHGMSGQRLDLVKTLSSESRPPAFLLATATRGSAAGLTDVFTQFNLIDWGEAIAAFRADPSGAGFNRETRSYCRGDDEVRVADQVCETAKSLVDGGEFGRIRGVSLLRAAASSISALESVLIGWIEQSEEGHEELAGVDGLLDRVEMLREDSRLSSFGGLVGELDEEGIRHTVVFCEYRPTLDYLTASVEDSEQNSYVLHGGISSNQRKETLRRFEVDGGLLLTTTGASKGYSLNYVEAVIHYDLPLSPAAFAEREGRYYRYGREIPCTAYLFKDSSGALPFEDFLVGMAQSVDAHGGYPEYGQDELFQAAFKNL